MTPQAWKTRAGDFARQLMLPQQRQLFDYWMQLWDGDDWPDADAVRPSAIRRLLPHLIIVESRPAPESARVRLAGSALWDVYGGEITGVSLNEGAWNGQAAYWRRVYERMQAQPLPDCGHLCDKTRLSVLFWLRLPLRAKNGGIWLLGLDIALPASQTEGLLPNDDEAACFGTQPAARVRISPHARATRACA